MCIIQNRILIIPIGGVNANPLSNALLTNRKQITTKLTQHQRQSDRRHMLKHAILFLLNPKSHKYIWKFVKISPKKHTITFSHRI